MAHLMFPTKVEVATASHHPRKDRMATAEEHATLYGELRAELLARFFAYGRYFRTNHLSLKNTLGVVRAEGTGDPPANL